MRDAFQTSAKFGLLSFGFVAKVIWECQTFLCYAERSALSSLRALSISSLSRKLKNEQDEYETRKRHFYLSEYKRN